ncbi:pyrokinin-1 receptor-like [Culicoides brevitarsis]|uniref:pyrokinin-1 receptor-like n=1 Tax=Culicoides brevitarsis TaxID=469753 RepID=UPI00307C090E
MHTATNYYLFSLAVSDLLVLIAGLPVEMYITWKGLNMYPFSPAVCIIQSWICEVSANASVLTITAFTIERYVAICKPFLSHTMSKLSRAVKFILIIWAVAVCLAIPAAMELGIVDRGSHERFCTVVNSKSAANTFTLSVIIIFIFPMVVITILYILIGLQLRRSNIVNRGPSSSSVRLKHRVFKKRAQKTIVQVDVQNDIMLPFHETHNICINENVVVSPENGRINFSNRATNHGTRHVVNMLVAVVVTFFFCWGLFHLQRLFAVYYSPDGLQTYSKFTENLYWLSGIFYYFSTCVNPFLYNIMSHKFRSAFKDTIAQYVYRGDEQHQPKKCYCHSSSQRSTSLHSQSLNTCSSIVSSNQQQPLKQIHYKDIDLVKVKRPFIVSFRKIPCSTSISHNDPISSINLSQKVDSELECDYKKIINSVKFSLKENHHYTYLNGETLDFEVQNSKSKLSHRLIKCFDSQTAQKDFFNCMDLSRMSTNDFPFNNSLTLMNDSKKLEDNLNLILKQLVFKNETLNGQVMRTGKRNSKIHFLTKSKSLPCFTIDPQK